LAKDRFNISAAGDGKEGISIAGEQQPELILLNLGMSAKNGLEALKMLKARKLIRLVTVVVLCDSNSSASLRSFMSYPKPITDPSVRQ